MADLARVVVEVTTDSGFRATEIVADLRNAAEILFFPMHCVGFWDGPTGGHICPDEQRGQRCSHLGAEQPLDGYRRLVRDRLKGAVEVAFPHADVYIFLG